MLHPIALLDNLDYWAGNYMVKPRQLSDEDKQRVCLIEDLDKIQFALSGIHLSLSQFERFMNDPIKKLEDLINDQSAVLNRMHYDRRIQGADF